MITLRTMTQQEFEQFKASLAESYPADVARARGTTVEEERTSSDAQLADLFRDGLDNPEMRYWNIVDGEAGVVGNLWVALGSGHLKAFIYDIEIAPSFRGRGYAKAAMLAMEVALKPLGVRQIGLNVFAFNETAQHLYQRLGYSTTSMIMAKQLV